MWVSHNAICLSDVPRHSPVFCCPTQGVCQTACGGESQALRRECTVAGGDCRAAGETQGCRPERSLPVWQRQKVQEVLPPLKGSPAAPTGPAVRKAPHKLAQSAASQILLATLTVLRLMPAGLVHEEEGMRPGCDRLRNLLQVQGHARSRAAG